MHPDENKTVRTSENENAKCNIARIPNANTDNSPMPKCEMSNDDNSKIKKREGAKIKN